MKMMLMLMLMLTMGKDVEKVLPVVEEWGRQIGKLHDGNIVHGDLTTSNVMLRLVNHTLVFIRPLVCHRNRSLEVALRCLLTLG